MARVKFEPTQEQRDNVELLAAVGTVHPLIARMITDPATGRCISDKTLRKYFRDELELGLAKANGIVGGKLFEMASSGLEPACTMFWMKTRAGYKETNVNEHTGKDGEPLPAPTFGMTFPNGGPGRPATTGATEDPPADEEFDEKQIIREADGDSAGGNSGTLPA